MSLQVPGTESRAKALPAWGVQSSPSVPSCLVWGYAAWVQSQALCSGLERHHPHPTSRQQKGLETTFNDTVAGGRVEGRAGYTNCCRCCGGLVAALLARSLAFSVAASAVSFAFSLASLAVSTRVLEGASPAGRGRLQRMLITTSQPPTSSLSESEPRRGGWDPGEQEGPRHSMVC